MSLLAQSLLATVALTAGAWVVGLLLDRPWVAAAMRARMWAIALWTSAAVVPAALLANLLPLHSLWAGAVSPSTVTGEPGPWPVFEWVALAVALIGSGVALGAAAGRLSALRRLVDAAMPLDHPALALRLADQAHRMCMAGAELRVSPAAGPLVVSHPRAIVLPSTMVADLNVERLALICGHELAHLKRGDDRAIAIETLIIALFWFNPFLPAVWRRLNAAREEVCDQVALAGADGQMRKVFAETLIGALKWRSLHTPAPALGGPRLCAARSRLRAVLNPTSPSRLAGRAAVLAATLMIAASAGASVALASQTRPPTPPAKATVRLHTPLMVPEMTPTGDMAPAVDPGAPDRPANGRTPLMAPTGALRAAYTPPATHPG